METKRIIRRILSLPEKFYSPENNQSIYSLLQETGYFEAFNNINESTVKEALEHKPQYVDQWLSWSGDKRTDSGWYFIQDGNQKYIVGFLDCDKGTIEKMEYSDRKSACASFIIQEIESIRKS
ncbi:MAG: hypothetical protein ACLFR2_13190 [Candidatus Kapaibacterium sp.]